MISESRYLSRHYVPSSSESAITIIEDTNFITEVDNQIEKIENSHRVIKQYQEQAKHQLRQEVLRAVLPDFYNPIESFDSEPPHVIDFDSSSDKDTKKWGESNKDWVLQALRDYCSGIEFEEMSRAIHWAETSHVLILFRREVGRVQALYTQEELPKKLVGPGPPYITFEMVKTSYRYDGRGFQPVPNQLFEVDAVTLHNYIYS